MQEFSEIGFRKRPPKEILLFLLGLFSTWQILQIAGLALSTWLTALTAAYLLITHGFDFRKDWLLLLLLAGWGITLITGMTSNLPGGYKKAAVMGAIQWLLIFVICCYMRKEKTTAAADSFLRGFDWSCRIQLVWCVLQKLFDTIGAGNLNYVVFGQLLHISDDPSLYLNATVSGLHWHVANLTPVLVYFYFRYPNIILKALCLLIVFFTKSATSMIALALCVFFDLAVFCKRTLCDRNCTVRYKVAVYTMLAVGGLVLLLPVLFPKVKSVAEYLFLRLYQINNPSAGQESSAVHFNYYRYLPTIVNSIPLDEALFGSGIGTSGHRFTVLLWQFPDAIWTVESDPVNLILSQGILGAMLHYIFIAVTIRRLRRSRHNNMIYALLVLILCGFAYNNQFIWVLLLELILYCREAAVSSQDRR